MSIRRAPDADDLVILGINKYYQMIEIISVMKDYKSRWFGLGRFLYRKEIKHLIRKMIELE